MEAIRYGGLLSVIVSAIPLVGCTRPAFESGQVPPKSAPTYSAWMAKNAPELSPRLMAKVTAFDHQSYPNTWVQLEQRWYISDDGSVTTTTHDPDDNWHYDEHPLSAQQMRDLKDLSSRLPDDKHFLPPFPQYLVIQTNVDCKEIDHVYDLTDVPEIATKFCRAANLEKALASWNKNARLSRNLVEEQK